MTSRFHNHLISPIIGFLAKTLLDPVVKPISSVIHKRYPEGRKDPKFSNIIFGLMLFLIFLILIFTPAANLEVKIEFIIQFIIITAIFSIMAISLNLHTGYTGIVNFGVIFFVGIGAVTTSLLNAKYGVDPFIGMFIGIILSMALGWLLAYPTVRLRSDYFAIVTIAIGEILRVTLNVETTLRARTGSSGISTPGIANFEKPFETWYLNSFPDSAVKYSFILMLVALFFLGICFYIAKLILNSPYGRVLKSIREDEDIVKSYGYDVFRYKASILAIGAGIAAVGGSIWAWVLGNIFPDFMDPVTSTFLVWAAFVLGGKGNNKGMIVGASIITLSSRVFRQLSNINRDTTSNFFLDTIDFIFDIIVVKIGGFLFGENSYQTVLTSGGRASVDVNYLQLVIIGMIILVVMLKFEEGTLPELPYRPKNPSGKEKVSDETIPELENVAKRRTKEELIE